jgi:hypothetical protein
VRATRGVSGSFRIDSARKSISSDSGSAYLSKRRAGSLLQFLEHPTETPLFDKQISWIEVDYPEAKVASFGLEFHWLVWFAIVMTLVWIVGRLL